MIRQSYYIYVCKSVEQNPRLLCFELFCWKNKFYALRSLYIIIFHIFKDLKLHFRDNCLCCHLPLATSRMAKKKEKKRINNNSKKMNRNSELLNYKNLCSCCGSVIYYSKADPSLICMGKIILYTDNYRFV